MSRGIHRRTPIRTLLAEAAANQPVELTGWVKTARHSKNVSFVEVMDGSTPKTVQVVFPADGLTEDEKAGLSNGAAVRLGGIWVESPGGGQDWEIQGKKAEVVGPSDASTFPIQKKRTTFEHLRTIAHLRPKTNTQQAVVRVRNAVSWHIHKFFQENGFKWIHTPIITASDAEGAGELFHLHTGADRPEDEFFGQKTFLTVSGQLEVECFAQSHTDVYTFGPTFRAENSNTPRHAAEFWMVEPEMAFADLDDVIALAEDFVRTVAQRTIEQCADDFAFFDLRIEKGLLDSLNAVIESDFHRVTYREAQKILEASGRSFEFPVGWGTSLQAEHERFLAEEHFNGPVFVTNYPIDQKAFYMRVDDGEETVSAVDLLVPRIGEMIGGSQREERLDVLLKQMELRGMDPSHHWWYADLRRWGTTPHGGFGLGLERMLMWLTGMKNIRDVIPFPRVPGHAEF